MLFSEQTIFVSGADQNQKANFFCTCWQLYWQNLLAHKLS